MLSRREFLRTGTVVGTTVAAFRPDALARVTAAGAAVAGRAAEEIAADESYWREIQQAFTLDRTFINLNNGYTCPTPRVVHEALKRYLDLSNESPYTYMWQTLEPGIESVRRNLAAEAGCDPEEMAITRNSSEALQIAQMGIDLKAGDEVVTTEQDYPRMLTTWDQRARREGVKVTKIGFPAPPPGGLAELKTRIEQAISPKTKVIHICHITNLTGQIFPVRDIARMARQRGIRTIIDGAHAFAHFPYKVRDLECDYYGVSLHKWLLAPVGTGFLYVRRENIATTWPLQAAPATKDTDIRKFEEIGTHPAANHNAIAEALQFHQAMGTERRAARMRYLRARWESRVEKLPGVRILTSKDPEQSCGLVNVALDNFDVRKVVTHLWSKHRIVVTTAGVEGQYQGLRITPNIYTTLDEIDTFAAAIESLVRTGLPKETA
jgi:selenocysteine lyase/cysteine desulfurase